MIRRLSKKKLALYDQFEDQLYNNLPDEEIIKTIDKFELNDLKSVVFSVIVERRLSLLNYLYKKDVPFTYTQLCGADALHVASAISGSLEAVKFLVERNLFSDINAKTVKNETPFLLAVMYEHEDIVEYFFDNFAPDLSITTIYGDTAFTLAEKSGNEKIAAMLEHYC